MCSSSMGGPSHAATVLLVIVSLVPVTFSSDGDSSPYYQKCVRLGVTKNCSSDGQLYKNGEVGSWLDWLTSWKCADECRYVCMWRTVSHFHEPMWRTPKFHGKWPFVRVFGMQELGSVIGSILNLAAHLYAYNRMQASFSSRNTPLLWLWRFFAAVCIHAWVWSIIFHTRDTPFTEFMDYSCALSMMTIFFVTCILRLTYGKSMLIAVLVTITSLIYFVDHVRYLHSGRIDYEYNMKANIVPGALAVLLWTAWGSWRCGRYPYTWRILLFNALTTMFMSLELLDFPPFLHTWDAHALWHLSTSFLPIIFYRFVFDDLAYLRQSWPENVDKSGVKIL